MKYNVLEDKFEIQIQYDLLGTRYGVMKDLPKHVVVSASNAGFVKMLREDLMNQMLHTIAAKFIEEIRGDIQKLFDEEWKAVDEIMNPKMHYLRRRERPCKPDRSGTREERLEWCKQRAFEYLDKGDISQAFASFTSDVSKCDLNIDSFLLGIGLLSQSHSVEAAREWIDGFN